MVRMTRLAVCLPAFVAGVFAFAPAAFAADPAPATPAPATPAPSAPEKAPEKAPAATAADVAAAKAAADAALKAAEDAKRVADEAKAAAQKAADAAAAAKPAEAPPAPLEKKEPALVFGGFITGAMNYDTNSAALRPWLSQVTAQSDTGVLLFDAAGTRLNLTAQHELDAAKVKAFAEVDFKGQKTAAGDSVLSIPRLRHAYAELTVGSSDILVGQTWALIGWEFPTTFNWDFEFGQGNPYNRVPQIRYTNTSFGFMKISVAALLNSADNGSAGVIVNPGNKGTAKIGDNNFPIGQARIEVPILDGGLVALSGSGGVTNVAFTPDDGTTVRKKFTSGVPGGMAALYAKVPVSILTVSGKVWGGASGGFNSGIKQFAVVDGNGVVSSIPAAGGWLDVDVKLPMDSLAAVYGSVDNTFSSVKDTPLPLERNWTVGGLVSKTWAEKMKTGLEVQYAQTDTGKDSFNDVRVSLVGVYTL